MNRLANATSPYLLQHADNPVDWLEWGGEAFDEARRRDVPIFLSVGYSSCHWCHVMAHESFEDEGVARLLNERFVPVKVDREERPDVDSVYMKAVQALTGRGGWPMSVFLTPEGRPFYAGTYWPREPVHGMPGFPRVLDAVSEAWRERRDEVLESAGRITSALADVREAEPGERLDLAAADEAAELALTRAWDRQHGGFGTAPKFPMAMTVEWLLHRHVRTGDPAARDAAVHALDAMARGGIHDQLAGGFARYSTDERWLVPHFEKMLYDNALLLGAYAAGVAVTGRADLRRTAASTAGYLLTRLRTPDGAFASSLDADSEGEEGRYYVWDHAELVATLERSGHDPQRWSAFFGASPQGNFEGANVLHEPVARDEFARRHGLEPDAFARELEQVRSTLLAAREQRVPPDLDDKVLTDWNALAIRSLVRAGLLLDEPDWVAAGREVAEQLHRLHVVDGRLHHVRRGSQVSVPAMLDDHALLALADLELFGALGDPRSFERARQLAEEADRRFHDDAEGGWFTTAHDAEALYTRPKETWDNAVPSGTSVMVEVCRVLAGLTGESRWRARAEEGVLLLQEQARRLPTGYGWLLRQVEELAAGPREVAVVGPAGPAREALAGTVTRHLLPGVVSVVSEADHGDGVPLLAGRGTVDGRAAAYVCRDLACELPVTSAPDLEELLVASGRPAS